MKDLYCAAGPCAGVGLDRFVDFDGGLWVTDGFDGGRLLGAFLLANWTKEELEKYLDWLLHRKDLFEALMASCGSNEGAVGDKCRIENERNIATLTLLLGAVSSIFLRRSRSSTRTRTLPYKILCHVGFLVERS